MLVCHVNFAKGFRGGERQTALLITGIADRGIDQQLLVRHDSPLRHILRDVPRLKIVACAKPYLRYLSKGVYADVLHAHEAKAAQWAYLNYLRTKTPYVITRRVPNRQGEHWFNRKLYRRAAAVVALSSAIKDRLKVLTPANEPLIIPSMYAELDVNVNQLEMLRRQYAGKFIVGHVGALVKRHKGQQYLIAAARLLQEAYPSIHILLLGGGQDEDDLKLQAEGLSNVEFLGHQDKLGAYYQLFNVFAFPSLEEGLGSSLLDAIFAACPIVASEVDGIPDIVRHEENGLLVPPRDSMALFEAIIRLFKDESLRNRLVSCATRDLPKFSRSEITGQYLTLYQQRIETMTDESSQV